MRCPSCGRDNREGASFCGECEAALAAELVCAACSHRPAEAAPPCLTPTPTPAPAVPTSFVSGRYQVRRFLGEGGKKRVYLAHDTRLDRDVAFSLIKTEGRTRRSPGCPAEVIR